MRALINPAARYIAGRLRGHYCPRFPARILRGKVVLRFVINSVLPEAYMHLFTLQLETAIKELLIAELSCIEITHGTHPKTRNTVFEIALS
ncbi:MAG: hypothetical protein HOE53_03135 [Candidatus Magasanikbacteria bacterium]|nr:hypothetical protein [Candidatus Magasanikbacteria bacterium]